MKCLKHGADQDPQRSRQDRVSERQPETRTDEADGDGKEVEITQEPKGALVDDPSMTLVLGYEADGTVFDRHTESPADRR
jgi:hypothetical protein